MSTQALLVNAAEGLQGFDLGNGWIVGAHIPPRPNATGGHFSICYWARHADGQVAFCKVLNYQAAFFSGDVSTALQGLTEAYNFERDLVRLCGERRMSKVVTCIADGQLSRAGYALPTVSFLLFEVADHDIRAALDAQNQLDDVFRLRCLHHVAIGLQQLHKSQVAHQDLKPSNVLLFPPNPRDGRRVSKVGDLGRASMIGRSVMHDAFPIAGDQSYAPPEQLYGFTAQSFAKRRFACDLYQFGSLISFVFTGATMNGLLTLELFPDQLWRNWNGDYPAVLPYVRDAFGRCLNRIQAACPDAIAHQLTDLIKQLCDPDPDLRGHRGSRRHAGNPYALHRVVTELDLLARRAELNLRTRR